MSPGNQREGNDGKAGEHLDQVWPRWEGWMKYTVLWDLAGALGLGRGESMGQAHDTIQQSLSVWGLPRPSCCKVTPEKSLSLERVSQVPQDGCSSVSSLGKRLLPKDSLMVG